MKETPNQKKDIKFLSDEIKIWINKTDNLKKLIFFTMIPLVIISLIMVIILLFNFSSDSFPFFENNGTTVNLSIWNNWLINSKILATVLLILSLIVFSLLFLISINLAASESNITADVSGEKEDRTVDDLNSIKTPRLPISPPAFKKNTKKSEHKLDISLPKLPPKLNQADSPSNLKKKKVVDKKSTSNITTDIDLGIPDVPLKKAIKISKTDLKDQLVLEKESKDPNIKTILIECQICKKTIKMPVLKKLVLESELPVVDVTYIHGNPPHALTAQLDKDFQVRRRRSAPIMIQDSVKKFL